MQLLWQLAHQPGFQVGDQLHGSVGVHTVLLDLVELALQAVEGVGRQ